MEGTFVGKAAAKSGKQVSAEISYLRGLQFIDLSTDTRDSWKLPFSQKVPLSKYQKPSGNCKLGTRIIPSEVLFQHLADKPKNYIPRIGELKAILPKPQTWAENAYGRRLESFFVRLLTCNEGYVFESNRDASIDRLFYRKDAMLSAAISITVELNG